MGRFENAHISASSELPCSAFKALCYSLLCYGVGIQVSNTEQSQENCVLMKHSNITYQGNIVGTILVRNYLIHLIGMVTRAILWVQFWYVII
jgi:hypothetical protein